MKKYNVVFSLSYEVEAEEESEAIDKGEKMLVDEIGNLHWGLTATKELLTHEGVFE